MLKEWIRQGNNFSFTLEFKGITKKTPWAMICGVFSCIHLPYIHFAFGARQRLEIFQFGWTGYKTVITTILDQPPNPPVIVEFLEPENTEWNYLLIKQTLIFIYLHVWNAWILSLLFLDYLADFNQLQYTYSFCELQSYRSVGIWVKRP